MSARELIQSKRTAILALAAAHGASNVRLFGSVARDQDTSESDIDFLVTLEPDRSLLDHAALMLALQELLGRPIDVATERGLKPKFRDRILREAIPL